MDTDWGLNADKKLLYKDAFMSETSEIRLFFDISLVAKYAKWAEGLFVLLF